MSKPDEKTTVTPEIKPLNHSDYIVQMTEPEYDRDCLRRKLFNVNMRLLKSSQQFRTIVEECIEYMKWVLNYKFEKYQSNPNGGTYGISGANVGIPFNIIAFHKKEKDGNQTVQVMINPKIIRYGKNTSQTHSNCGSINLPNKISFPRPREITVRYFDIEGASYEAALTPTTNSYTVQHEVDHNNGILIVDRYKDQYHEWPADYIKMFTEGGGKLLTDSLDKRKVLVVTWNDFVCFEWFNCEVDAIKALKAKSEKHKDVMMFPLECSLELDNKGVTTLVKEELKNRGEFDPKNLSEQ